MTAGKKHDWLPKPALHAKSEPMLPWDSPQAMATYPYSSCNPNPIPSRRTTVGPLRAGRHRSDHSRLPPFSLPSFRSSSLAPLSGFPPLPNNTLLGLRASRVLPERRPSKQVLCQQGGAIPDCVLRPRDSTARGGVGLLSLTPTTHCQDSERTSTLTSQGIPPSRIPSYRERFGLGLSIVACQNFSSPGVGASRYPSPTHPTHPTGPESPAN